MNVPLRKAVFLKRINPTEFVISIIMTGDFGPFEQRHGKFLISSSQWGLSKQTPDAKEKFNTCLIMASGVRIIRQ